MRTLKNTWADYVVCLVGIAAFGARAIHGVLNETFTLGTRHYPATTHVGATAVWLGMVDILLVALFSAWLLRNNRWRNLAYAALSLLTVSVMAGVLINKS